MNSSGNQAGELSFPAGAKMTHDLLTLGFSKSPQYEDYAGSGLTYYFSSSGLASTAGAIQLFENDVLADEICWGKDFCAQ